MIEIFLNWIDNWSFPIRFMAVSLIGLIIIEIIYLFVIWKILPLHYEKYLGPAKDATILCIISSLVFFYPKELKEKVNKEDEGRGGGND